MLCQSDIVMIRFTFLVALCCVSFGFAQVGIGTITPSDASMLEISSTADSGATYKGLMPPRVPLETDRDNINATAADAGLIVFVMATNCLDLWNGSSWENVYCSSVMSTNTEVEFSVLTQTLNEGAGGVSLNFTLTNPSATMPTLVTVEASDYSDLDESTSQVVVIPANTSSFAAADVFTITDDSAMEVSEDVVFTITAVSGGIGSPTIGTNSTHILTILDNDSVFTGVSQNFDLLTSWTYASDVAFFDNGSDGYYGIDDGTNIDNVTGMTNNFLGLEDLNDEGNGTTGFATLTFASVNVTGGTGLNVSFNYSAFNVDTGDDIYYTIIIDGVDQTEVFLVDGVSDLTVSGIVTEPIPDGSTTVGLRVRFRQNGPDQMGFDDFAIN